MRVVLLDAGPLGLAVHPRAGQHFRDWLAALLAGDAEIVIPEIAHYEVRRELLRIGQERSIARLDQLLAVCSYAPLTTAIVIAAAGLWADARRAGRPTGDRHALDGDVLLAATALALAAEVGDVVVATTNERHLAQFVVAAHWERIAP